MKDISHQWIVALLGARMHYAIPRILQQAGLLNHLYTDICAVKGLPQLLQLVPQSLQPPSLRRLLGRVPQKIPIERITAFNRFGLEYTQKLRQARSPAETTATFLWAGKTFCQLILEQGWGNASGIYTFNTAGLELLQNARQRGLLTITEQTIAPKAIEYKLLQEEYQNFPDWERPLKENSSLIEFSAREQAEWLTADIILCGSEFVREGVIACGGSAERCQVLPYGVDLRFSLPERLPHAESLRVLTIGGVGLRKGSPYVLDVAKQLQGLAKFRLVGPLNTKPEIESALTTHVKLIGAVPRSQILDHYAWADVFLLPSICEGSATVIYEALAAGLPVICTPNAGSVVRDGIDGFIVPIRNPEAIVQKIELLARQPELRRQMSQNALKRANEYTLDKYGQRLLKILNEM
ncbi:glycosyltransferase family 4 protein [Calothrix sp. FACHB-1219]|uniref:glycosyltransferase family 4 protein n=1 Tax=unclassified Calothrix TaxID=2619626 RepID=UPI0016848E2B|nr:MULTISPECIES: glycosyltransferase family 4 protein [unclassified Calothrix]MBD2201175.1 glycosyltransferase family 4 protein [Calothrix sp. FACHB-168]MBD2215609.1 glycosyltransferase family 4 protein [Calothrix sp. FACHB-1219]